MVASTIVTGRSAEEHIPASLRCMLSAESGFNDGLALPFVLLPIVLHERATGEALLHWVTRVVLWEVGVGAIAGVLIGYAAGRLLLWWERHEVIQPASLLSYALALALLALGMAQLLGTDGILAVFTTGLAFDLVASRRGERERLTQIQEAFARFFFLPVFALFGLALPWGAWSELGERGLLLVVLILVLRRLPGILLLRRAIGNRSLPDVLVLGWFGPIGVAALYYGTVAERRAGAEEVWAISSLVSSRRWRSTGSLPRRSPGSMAGELSPPHDPTALSAPSWARDHALLLGARRRHASRSRFGVQR